MFLFQTIAKTPFVNPSNTPYPDVVTSGYWSFEGVAFIIFVLLIAAALGYAYVHRNKAPKGMGGA